jgi:hypothetical protein
MGAMARRYWERSIGSPRIFGCGELVVQATTQTWTARASGRSAPVDVVELFPFTDGLVSEIRVFDQEEVRVTVGRGTFTGVRP